jgi:hypothetical protein
MRKIIKIPLYFTAFIIALFILMILSQVLFSHAHHINQFDQFLHHYQIQIAIWRYSCMLLFIVFYPKLIQKLYQHSIKAPDVIKKLCYRRWAILFCILYEAIIVHNVFSLLISKLVGG